MVRHTGSLGLLFGGDCADDVRFHRARRRKQFFDQAAFTVDAGFGQHRMHNARGALELCATGGVFAESGPADAFFVLLVAPLPRLFVFVDPPQQVVHDGVLDVVGKHRREVAVELHVLWLRLGPLAWHVDVAVPVLVFLKKLCVRVRIEGHVFIEPGPEHQCRCGALWRYLVRLDRLRRKRHRKLLGDPALIGRQGAVFLATYCCLHSSILAASRRFRAKSGNATDGMVDPSPARATATLPPWASQRTTAYPTIGNPSAWHLSINSRMSRRNEMRARWVCGGRRCSTNPLALSRTDRMRQPGWVIL